MTELWLCCDQRSHQTMPAESVLCPYSTPPAGGGWLGVQQHTGSGGADLGDGLDEVVAGGGVHGQVHADPKQPHLAAGEAFGQLGGVLGRGIRHGVAEAAFVRVEAAAGFEAGALAFEPVGGGPAVPDTQHRGQHVDAGRPHRHGNVGGGRAAGGFLALGASAQADHRWPPVAWTGVSGVVRGQPASLYWYGSVALARTAVVVGPSSTTVDTPRADSDAAHWSAARRASTAGAGPPVAVVAR